MTFDVEYGLENGVMGADEGAEVDCFGCKGSSTWTAGGCAKYSPWSRPLPATLGGWLGAVIISAEAFESEVFRGGRRCLGGAGALGRLVVLLLELLLLLLLLLSLREPSTRPSGK